MVLEETLDRYFDDLTSSMRFTIGSSDVQLQRRRDGVLESLVSFTGRQKSTLMESIGKQVNDTADHGVLLSEYGKPAAFQFVWLPGPDQRILVIKRYQDATMRSLAEMGIEPGDAERIREMLRPPEGVIVVSCPWSGGMTRSIASLLQEGWVGSGETAVHIADSVYSRLPGITEMRVDSTDRPGLSRVVNAVRKMELLPVVISLHDEQVALEEAFRLAQLDYRVYVICDSRNVLDTVSWLRRKVDRWVLSEYLAGVIHLREVIALCPKCKRPDTAPDERKLMRVGLSAADAGGLRVADGCPNCIAGMSGILLAWEMLSMREHEEICPLLKGDCESELMGAVAQARGTTFEQRAREMLLTGRSSLHLVEHAAFRPRFRT